MNTDISQYADVEKAFTLQSVNYDEYEKDNPTLTRMRDQVRRSVLSILKQGDKILELNAGTGTDAIFFAQKGFSVFATDASDGMIEQLKRKTEAHNLSDKITIQLCSYTELDKIGERKFDLIFSNFGGLNCIPDIRKTTKFFPTLLNKNGKVCFVILPPVCPWELVQLFKGKFLFAFRRLKKDGAMANIEGIKFTSYYFSLKDVLTALGNDFKLLGSRGLCIFSPQPQMGRFPKKFPRITKLLNKIDEKLSGVFPFNRVGDHIIVTAEYTGKN